MLLFLAILAMFRRPQMALSRSHQIKAESSKRSSWGRRLIIWFTQLTDKSTSQTVRANTLTRAHIIEDRTIWVGYEDNRATCIHAVAEISNPCTMYLDHVPRKSNTLHRPPVNIFVTCRCVTAQKLCRGMPSFRPHEPFKALGWACAHTSGAPSRIVTPIAVRRSRMHSPTHTTVSSLSRHSHTTFKFQILCMTVHTRDIECFALGPFVATTELSRICCRARTFAVLVHCTTPLGVASNLPNCPSLATNKLQLQTLCRSALWALNGPPIGIACVRLHSSPPATTLLS